MDEVGNQSNNETVASSPKPKAHKSFSVRRVLRNTLLAAVFLRGAGGLIADAYNQTPLDSPIRPTLMGGIDPIPNNPVEASIAEVEQKYGIDILTQKQAYSILGLKYDENDPRSVGNRPPIRWSQEQVDLLDQILSHAPPEFYKQWGRNKLGIFIGDFGTDCACSGITAKTLTGDRILIGIQADTMRASDKEDTFSTVIHELVHRYDDFTKQSTWSEIKTILGDQSYLTLPEFQTPDSESFSSLGASMEKWYAVKALKSFADEGGHDVFREGVAMGAELYVKGKVRFLKALGPLLDNGGYSQHASRITDADLEKTYPKTLAFYNLYERDFFGELEYDPSVFGESSIWDSEKK